jgi:hypothetical protein
MMGLRFLRGTVGRLGNTFFYNYYPADGTKVDIVGNTASPCFDSNLWICAKSGNSDYEIVVADDAPRTTASRRRVEAVAMYCFLAEKTTSGRRLRSVQLVHRLK